MKDSELALVGAHAPHASGTDSVQNAALMKLARCTIDLSQVAPRLSELASSRQNEAMRQAEQLRQSADTVREMAATLKQTMEQLRLSTTEIGQLTSAINRIADETRMIAINAGIVAANAGEQGRAFAVLAKETRTLSETTSDTTRDVHGKVRRLEESTLRAVQTIGLQEDNATTQGLALLLHQMESADADAVKQVSEARELNKLGSSLRDLSEEMIAAVGSFRLDVHKRIEDVVELLRKDATLMSGDPSKQHAALRQALKRNPSLELAYITDVRGIQTLDNVSRTDFKAVYGDSGRQHDWSSRAWFTGAMKTKGVYLSEIYRSQATDEFCLTASATFDGAHGRVAGVVAIDVNFREILRHSR